MISQDGGATWGADSTLPSAIVRDLAFDSTNANYLFAFTHGRGVWRTPLPGAPANCSFAVAPASIAAGEEGGVFPVTVAAPPGCAWSAIPGSNTSQFSLQAPSQGVGNGIVYLAVQPQLGAGTVSDSISVAAQPVAVQQAAPVFLNVVGDLRTAAASLAIPSIVRVGASKLTVSAGDPIPSCTGSADFGTGWWQVTPSVSGYLNVQARGDRLDVFGNSGIVLTAYANAAPATELGCATVPRDSTGRTLTGIVFPVTAGQTYTLEIAALTSDGLDTNYNLIVAMGSPVPSVSVTPVQSAIDAGAGTIQMNATVTGPPNQGVRWSISPQLGRISQTGQYTPPATVTAATTVTVTATSFADSTRSASATVSVLPPALPPVLSISISHTGILAQGQTGATYTLTVSNAAGSGPTSGTVTVTETVPSGMTLVSMAGAGWTCPAGGTTCTRSDALAAGASYPAITVTVNVASNAPASVTNQASVSGGGSATANASDPTTTIIPPQISSGDVVSAGLSSPPVQVASPNAILSIFGQNFAPAGASRKVSSGDLVNGLVPTNLAGVCVLFGAQRAPIFLVTPGQLNLQAPQLPASGSVTVQVVTNCDTASQSASATVTVPVQAAAPEFFYAASDANGKNPIAAADGVTLGGVGDPSRLGPGFALGYPGEIVVIYATGLGLSTPAYAPGQLPPAAAPVSGVTVLIDGAPVSPSAIQYVGVTPLLAGVYQLNLQLPAGLAPGDHTIAISVNGVSSPPGGYISTGLPPM